MLINGIEFPPDILKAINDDKLVIFAGAGVSKNAPSNLPDFKGLAIEIGRLCDKEFNDKEDEIDEFLGDLERENVKVKEHVAEVLSVQDSRPNSFHKNILKLFRKPEVVRIVTTNQDELFEAAALEIGFRDVRIYSAPALPYGNDFSGIIHIHGKVSDPSHIIVTDTDFGNAYMLNGFATNFLVDLFKEYIVLFVGYSYNDRIVRYLTTAIKSKNISNAFILSEDISPKLKRTRIEGIPFGKDNFVKECDALGIIGNYTKRGILDWQQRISNLNLDSPPIDGETRDELLNGIRMVSVQKHFCSVIKGQDWPEWLDQNQVFEPLFDEKAVLSEQDWIWADWLATNYCDNKLLVLIERHGVKVNKHFCSNILNQFQNQDKRFSDDLFCLYVSLLIDKIDEETEFYSIIQISNARKQDHVKWTVFWNMLKYQLILEKSSIIHNENQNYRIKYNWNSSDSLVKMVWENELSSQIIDARSTFLTCVKIIEDLYQRLSCWSSNKNTYVLDYLDIEKNENSYHLYEVELVVCEIFEKAFQEIKSVNPQLAFELLIDLISSEYTLLRRMALLLLRLYCQNDANRIMEALLEHFTFYELAEREQIFKLVAKFFDCISDEKRKQVIDKIWNVDVEGMIFASSEKKERHINYSRYNWLKWIESKSNHLTEISDKLSIIHALFPDFVPRERPDLVIGPIKTRWGSESPISKEKLGSFSYKDACEYLMKYKEDNSLIGPDRYGLMQTVSDLCEINTKWGINIINELKNRDYWEDDLWDSIFRGLSKGIEKKNLFSSVLNCIDDKMLVNCGRTIANFVYDVIYKEAVFTEITEHLKKRLVKLVERMWPFREASEFNEVIKMDYSLNSTTGILTHVLIRLVFLQPSGTFIPSWLDSIVKRQIEKSEYIGEYICVMCGYSAQLFYRNPDWTREHVLIYLDDDNSAYKKAAWNGFLELVRNFNVEFGNEVLPYFKRNISFVFDLEPKIRSRFIHDYALLMVYITDDPSTTHLNELIRLADNAARKRFAQSIALFLEKMKAEERSDLWNRWLKKYWRNRNNNIPVELSSEEYDQMLFWLIGLPEYEEGVDIALESNVKFISANLFINKIRDTEEPRHFPEKTALLIIHLFKHSDKNVRYTRMNGLINILKNLVSNELRTELDEIMEYL